VLQINPAYEIIVCPPSESFRWNVHDYPHHLAKWHFHPEYELHLIQHSAGKMMIGDYIGPFEPECLVLTGPHLPHNWVSDVAPNQAVPRRDMLIQFSPELATSMCDNFAELREVGTMLKEAAFGVQFHGAAAKDGRRLLRKIGTTSGPRRLILFIELLDSLSRNRSERRILSRYAPALGLHTAASERLQMAMTYVYEHYTSTIRLNSAAKLCGMEISTFSRFFKKQTGHTFARFVNLLRVHHACTLLSGTDLSVTQICFESGFNNTANFNRQFGAICRKTPREYRFSARQIATAN
jgi:AraC-like DNA-binding protein